MPEKIYFTVWDTRNKCFPAINNLAFTSEEAALAHAAKSSASLEVVKIHCTNPPAGDSFLLHPKFLKDVILDKTGIDPDLSVFKSPFDRDSYMILDSSKIEEKNLCECKDEYGQDWGCTDAECYTSENSYVELKEGEEEHHTRCRAFEFFDGSNWRSWVVEILNGNPHVDIKAVDDITENKILREYSSLSFPEFENGESSAESEHYIFTKSLSSSDPSLALVSEK
jgi:hypothetical protein